MTWTPVGSRRGGAGARAGGARRGFALLASLWLVVALAAVALELSLEARARRLAAANALEGAQGRASARAGLAAARAALAGRGVGEGGAFSMSPAAAPLDPWARAVAEAASDSATLGASSDGPAYRVVLRDVGAALNANRAREDDLRRLMIALRVDAGEADRAAQAIADWRDADDFRRARGAETNDYLRLGLAVLPRNAPFADLAELRSVASVSPALYDRVAPFLTLVGTGQVNVNVAPRPVLLSLPGFGEEAAAALLRARAAGRRVASLDELSRELSSSARARLVDSMSVLLPRVTFATREVEVTSDGWAAGGRGRARVTALVVRAGDEALTVWERETP